MLFHLSIEADDPRHVATVLAEIWQGRAYPFPPVGEGSWMAIAGDDRGTMIEVYRRGTELHEAEGDADAIGIAGQARRHHATHFAMATPLDEAAILAIGAREGWPAKYRKRGGQFGVIELWIDGCTMAEVLTAEMQREYLETITIANADAMLGAMIDRAAA